MDLQLELLGKNLIVRISGELDLVVADEFRLKVEKALDDHPVQNILINMSKVDFIDSSGLGVILGRYKRISLTGGKIALAVLKPQVKRILELSGLLKIMEQYDSEEEALDQLKLA